MRLFVFFAGFLFFLGFFYPAYGDYATSTNFTIERAVIDVGGEFSTSSGFRERSSIGQPATGISTSTSFILKGGFLYFVEPAAAPTTTPQPTTIIVGAGGGGRFIPATPTPEEILRLCDFNGDRRCNLIDLSIMLFHYERAGAEIARYDLLRDDRVDFADVSVLMYYWTG